MRLNDFSILAIISFLHFPISFCASNLLSSLAEVTGIIDAGDSIKSIFFNDGMGPRAFGLWYTIPSIVRKNMLEQMSVNWTSNDGTTGSKPAPLNLNVYERLEKAFTFAELEAMAENQMDLVRLAKEYLSNFKYSVAPETSNNLTCLIIAKATPKSLATILETCHYFRKIISGLGSIKLTKLMDAYGRIANDKDSIDLLYILERYIDFEMSSVEVLIVLRAIAIRDDDSRLNNFLDGFPDVIPHSNQCQQLVLDQFRGNQPNSIKIVCSRVLEAHPNGPEFFIDTPKMMKFNLFDGPVYIKYWSLDMILLASQEFDLLSKLSSGLRQKSSSKKIPPNALKWSTTMEELIPIIPNESIRTELVQKYGLAGKINPKVWKTTLRTLKSNGEVTNVGVLHPKDQIDSIDDEILTISRTFNEPQPSAAAVNADHGIYGLVTFVNRKDAIKLITNEI